MSIQIEEGKFYKRADGSVHGPACHSFGVHSDVYPWVVSDCDYTHNGQFYNDQPNAFDLVTEVADPAHPVDVAAQVAVEQPAWAAAVKSEAAEESPVKPGQKWRWLGKFNADMLTKGESYNVLDVSGDTVFIDDNEIRAGRGTTHTWLVPKFRAYFALADANNDMADSVALAFGGVIAVEPAAEPDIKTTIADEAKRIVSGARRSAYGKPEQNFERIARLWQAHFANTGRPEANVTANDISLLMVLMKIGRLAESPQHYDSWVDLVGYSLTGAEVNDVTKPA